MRVVVQKVSRAGVTVNSKVIGSIQKGLVIFLGIESEDTTEDADWLIQKIYKMRLFNDAEGVMNLSVKDIGGACLVISQFTLHASTKKGNRPSYYRAARPSHAIPLYEYFIEELWLKSGLPVQNGEFGAHMDVELINDGPVTITMDSKNKE